MGRELSLINKTSLYFDIEELHNRSLLADYTLRNYELGIFNLDKKRKIFKKKSFLLSKIENLLRPLKFVKEDSFSFNKNMLSVGSHTYLDGFWQTEKYFKNNQKIIRTDFTFTTNLDERNQNLAAKIILGESVSIHFRRGDYLSQLSASAIHQVCSLEFYKKAVELILQKVSNPHFFIFSDDIEWVKNNFIIASQHTFVDNNKDAMSFCDLKLMSLCKHNIIANSSFSWWGAWLNCNSSKIVISPKDWFRDKSYETTDLIPESWIRI